jgi:leader peptidase (prepilin peptidase)/N-methyltransferase
VSGGVIAALAVLGLFVGSAVWVLARNQAMRRPLLSGAFCDGPLSVSFSPAAASSTTEDATAVSVQTASSAERGCEVALPVTGWLPWFGFGLAWKCPACGKRQPVWRVVFEGLVAGYYALAAWRQDDWLSLTSVLVFAVPLLMILLVDLWTRLIYTSVIYAGVLAGLAFALADGVNALARSVLGLVAATLIFAGFYLLAIAIYHNTRVIPFGRGDIYLAAMIGAMVRWSEVLGALFYGIAIAGLAAVIILVTRRAGRRQAMPYGPFLCLGALLALAL